MTIDELLAEARQNWGDTPMTLDHIAVALMVNTGDVARQARNAKEGRPVDEAEVKKELGNMIYSSIRWCDDLGYSPEECIKLAQEAQAKYVGR